MPWECQQCCILRNTPPEIIVPCSQSGGCLKTELSVHCTVFAILGYDTEQDICKEFQKLIYAYQFPFFCPCGCNNNHRPHVTLSFKKKDPLSLVERTQQSHY